MSTRGIFGFKIGGKYKISANLQDSYPIGLGAYLANIMSFIRQAGRLEELEQKVRNVRMISLDKSYPSLNNIQGKELLIEILECDPENVIPMVKSEGLEKDSLFCEWGYIINFDSYMFEIYRGFQRESFIYGPFGDKATQSGFFPIKPIASFPLSEISKNHITKFDRCYSLHDSTRKNIKAEIQPVVQSSIGRNEVRKLLKIVPGFNQVLTGDAIICKYPSKGIAAKKEYVALYVSYIDKDIGYLALLNDTGTIEFYSPNCFYLD